MTQSIFINGFQKGQSENSQIGMGNLVGIDTYSKKGVARLSKKSTAITGGAFTSYPTFMDVSAGGSYIWLQLADGAVVYSADGGSNWQATSTAFPVSGQGNGMIFFQNFMFAFTDTKIYYWKDTGLVSGANPSAGAWVDWTAAAGGATGTLQNFTNNPISGLHFPFLFPNSRGVYFGNGGGGGTSNAAAGVTTIGFFGQVGSTLFNPGGTRGTDFLWDSGILSLPSYTYAVGSLDFLPPSNLAIAAYPYQNPAQGGDLITWDTVSANKFSPPLHIFGNSITGSARDGGNLVTTGIKQLFNRNQVLYAISGGNHTIYQTNGSTYNIVEDIALSSSMRTLGGAENDYPVFFNSFPSAICVIGNKLLTGVAPITNSSTYPETDTGFFPVGVWSVAFHTDGTQTTQCEYVIPFGSNTVSPTGNNNYAKITLVKPISTGSGTTQLLVGFAFSDGNVFPNTYGVSLVDLYKYIDNISYTAIESPFWEIGTALNPETVNSIEINLVKKLLTAQTISLDYRTSLADSWASITGNGGTFTGTFTGDGTKSFYQVTNNQIGKTRFLQLRVMMATTSANPNSSPEIRSVKIS